MVAAAPIPCRVTETYEGGARLLMTYGLGHPERRVWQEAHKRSGGRVVGWDLGYWHREEAMRLTIDDDHPARLLWDMPAKRWARARIALRNDCDPAGPIVLVGIGRKSRAQFGFAAMEWEQRTLAAIQQAYPGRPVVYRPKRPESLDGCPVAAGAIEDVLRGASLVVCRHSNVAVDACIAGVPVVCEDGAAAALYGSDLRDPFNPDVMQRRRFLENLAWWQWKPSEAPQAWQFLLTACA